MKKILVAIDGSDHSDNALKFAGDIAKKYQARLLILHVIDRKPIGPEGLKLAEVEFADRLAAAGLDEPPEKLQGFGAMGLRGFAILQDRRNAAVKSILGEEILNSAKKVIGSTGDLEVETSLLNGDPAKMILELAEKAGADLIVVGSRGLGDMKGMWLGSVSHKVSNLSPVSVITVR